MRLTHLSLTILLLAACGGPTDRTTRPTESGPDSEPTSASESASRRASTVTSLLGEPLEPVALPAETRADFEAKLAAAEADLAADPGNADALIWVGRRLAYLGRYFEAIDVFTRGIELHPADARFFRHRGHRYITTRQLDLAVADLEQAAELITGTEDQIEPDGLPNARGIPTSTLHSNIWYHLGLAHYLQHEFDAALAAYRECIRVSTNPDMQVATAHWLYMTLRRLGRSAEAVAVLEPIAAELDIIENQDYHRLLLLYKGELGESEVIGAQSDGPGSAAAATYMASATGTSTRAGPSGPRRSLATCSRPTPGPPSDSSPPRPRSRGSSARTCPSRRVPSSK